ncbi:SDR family NAD(P)-dependent oxidoreductase [Pseudomonas syringae]|uniref:SDR family NAD(P)-dependent oxidoreductase n=1 Tax=Pseudomonas syringae TaxID=317 RepID=UPI001373221E|nr:SDR family NAD(P)-dependent oxidoreductase [Pseudomonas syringae]NAO53892.1 SDR family NAD(P)-dependent oxidoreductase [Pseudomonas syringae]
MSNAVHNIYAVNRWRPIAGSPSLATDESVLVIIPVTSAAGVSPNRQRLLSLVGGQAHCSFTALDTLERMTATLADYIPGTIKSILWIGGSLDVSVHAEDQGLQYGVEEKIFFRFFKALLELKADEVRLSITVVTKNNFNVNNEGTNTAVNAGLHGFVGAAAKEYSHWTISLLDVDDAFVARATSNPSLVRSSQGIEKRKVKGQTYCCRDDQWYAEHLEVLPVENGSEPVKPIYRDNGVYLIIGGAGGLGQAWTESLLQRHDSQVIWAGRKAINDEIRHSLRAMERLGRAPLYVSVDATQPHQMEQLRHTILRQYGRLDGIIHSAIVLEDKTVANMSETTFSSALAAKVDICRNIENYFADLDLNFIAFYSSIQSFARQAGQSNYAAGCTFKDSFAHYLQAKCATTHVRAMNWGYWGTVGIVSDASYQKVLEKSGMASINPTIGMLAFEALIAGDHLQASFIAAYDPEKITLIDKVTLHQNTTEFGFVQSTTQLNNDGVEGCMMEYVYRNEHYMALREEGVFYLEDMDSYLCRIVAADLETLGVFSGTEFSVEDVLRKTDIRAGFSRWLTETLMSLVRQGYLRHDAGQFSKTAEFPESDASAAWLSWNTAKVEWLLDDNKSAQVKLVEALLIHTKEILTGKIKATDVMFPDSSMRMVEGIYKNNRVADYFNLVLSRTVVDEINTLLAADPQRKIRILEVGAGTGGTTAVLLKHLAPFHANIAEYCYTDLSKSFLFHAQREYGPGNPFLRYEIFNVEKSVDDQPLQRDYYDIAVATNVLHATRDIAASIRRVWEVLKDQGSLIVNELSRNTLFNHLTFGFLDGWWLYNDDHIRVPGSPVLEPATWHNTALQVGYGSTQFPAELAHDMGQFVMLMRAQKHAASLAPKVVESGSSHSSGNESSMHTPSNTPSAVNVAMLKAKSQAFFTDLIADVVQLPVDEIALDLSLEKLGFDSILVVTLTNKLREHFEQVSSSLLFDIDSVEGIIDYFIEQDKQALAALLGIDFSDAQPPSAAPVAVASHTQAPASAPAVTEFDVIDLGAFSLQEVDAPSASLPQVFDFQETYPEPRRSGDIAIIGLNGTYPGSRTLDEFWENLSQGRDLVTSVPKARWEQTGFNRVENPENFKGGFIDGFDEFDAEFFDFSETDALLTDPQERKFLECAFSVLEDAGYTKESLAESDMTTGVYVGAMYQEYQLHSETAKGLYEGQAISNSFASIANRVSYILNLEGPSVAIDSMCSSSLSAVHLACSALKLGEIDYAIAGGVNLTLHPNKYGVLKQGGDLSQTGKCASFSESADGYVPGEGVGAVLLKRYEDALRDGDHIYGVITGSLIVHAGKTNGYTVPSPKAHSKLISKVVQQAGIRSADISYIEAHGTGTNLGDAIEIHGLRQAFSIDQDSAQQGKFCSVGSVKSNIGHCESAAGMAGLTKILLQLKYQQIVPSLHSKKINKNLQIEKTSFSIPQLLSHWRLPNKEVKKRIAGLSSFGAGGANAHFIIEEHEEVSNQVNYTMDYPELIVLSAKSKEALHQRAAQLLGYIHYNAQQNTSLNNQPRYWLGNIAYTLQTGRTQMPYRLSFLADSIEHLEDNLDAFLNDKKSKSPLHVCYAGEMDATAKLLYEDNSLELILSEWLKQGKYQNIVALWAKGVVINWGGLLGKRGQRISLPTYPFSRNRHWLPMGNHTAGVSQKVEAAPVQQRVKTVAAMVEPVVEKVAGKIVQKTVEPVVGEPVITAPVAVEKVTAEPKSLFIHRWNKVDVSPHPKPAQTDTKICVVGLDTLDYFQRDLETCGLDAGSSEWQQVLPNGFAQSFADLAKSVSRQLAKKVKAWLADSTQPLHLQIIMPFDRQYQLYAALTGALEQHVLGAANVKLTIIYCEALCSFANISTLINRAADTQTHIAEYLCAHDSIYAGSVQKVSQPESGSLLNDNGVYVLANGLNEVGRSVIRAIDDETSGCHIAILGDALSAPDIDEQIGLLQNSLDNTKVGYYAAELDDRKSVFNALLLIKDQLGDVQGVHYIVPADDKVQQHKEPLKDKALIRHLAALINLDEATYSFDSQLQSFSIVMTVEEHDSKQLNTLAKTFARYRAALQGSGYREGKTVALEVEGNAANDIATAFIHALDKNHLDEQFAFIWKAATLADNTPVIQPQVTVEPPVASPAPLAAVAQKQPAYSFDGASDELQATVSWLVSISSELLDKESASFSPVATFTENGYESISIVGLCELINSRLGLAISVVVFFEHDTIQSLAQYLVAEHGDQIEEVLETDVED